MKKELPTIDLQNENLFCLPQAAVKWEILKTAIEFNLFDLLTEPETAGTVSSKLGTHAQNTEYMLNALVALGCLKKESGKFCNTPLAESCYTTGKDTSLGESLLFSASWTRQILNGGLKNLVLQGPPPPIDLSSDELWEKGARASINPSRCGRAQAVARYVSELPEFESFSKIIDLGAGPGIIGIAITAIHPSLKCVLFDQPAVCTVADEMIQEYGMEDRVTSQRGDYMRDDFGSGYDLIMAHYTLNFYKDILPDILRKTLKALKPGGVFMVTSDGVSKDRTAPAESIFSWLSTSLQGMDMSFETGLIARSMHEVGYVSTERRTLQDIDLQAHGSIEMTIGRKGSSS